MEFESYVADFFKEYQHCFADGVVVANGYSDKEIHDYIHSNYYNLIYKNLVKEYNGI